MRMFFLAALGAPALALGGCGTENRGVDTIKQPVVSRTDYVFDAQIAGGGFAPGEASRVAGWLDSLNIRYGDRIAVDDGGVYRGAVRGEVARMVAHYGLDLADSAPLTAAPVAPGTVRVVVTRASASVPGCPDFTRSGSSEFMGSTTSNFGCASNASMAAMVANPLDLVRGEPGVATFDTATNTRAVGAYRKAAPTGGGGVTLKTEATGGGSK